MIRISIIIPIYKVEAYIQRCLESIINQTWNTDDAAIECILVNDCTPDNSMQIVQEMIKEYLGSIHFVCLKHEVNRGLSAARNTGTAKATGDYILYIDSDDYIAPNSLQTFIVYLNECPDVDIVIGQVVQIPSNKLYSKGASQPQITNDPSCIFTNLLKGEYHIEAWNKLIKRTILKRNHITFIEGIFYEDVPWAYSLFSNLNSVLMIPETTYFYTFNPSGIMHQSTTDKKYEKAINCRTYIAQYLLDNPPASKFESPYVYSEYLLFIHKFIIRSLYIFYQNKLSKAKNNHFRTVTNKLQHQTIQKKEFIISLYNLILYWPLNKLILWSFFRKSHYYIEKTARRLSLLTTPLHNRNK